MKLLHVAAVLALLSTGVVKADVVSDCTNQAQAAHAVAYARDAGQPRSELIAYVDHNEEARYHTMLHRIINKIYDEPKISKETAYNGELTYCIAKHPQAKFSTK